MKALKRLGAWFCTLLAIGLIAGCGLMTQITGGPTPTDFNQKALAAELTIKTALDSATMLRTAGKITAADVKSIVAAADVAQEGVNVARALKKTAPTTPAADNRLQLALAGLAALQAYLATAGATP